MPCIKPPSTSRKNKQVCENVFFFLITNTFCCDFSLLSCDLIPPSKRSRSTGLITVWMERAKGNLALSHSSEADSANGTFSSESALSQWWGSVLWDKGFPKEMCFHWNTNQVPAWSTKHSSLQPGQWMQQLYVCKNSESQRVFYFLHLETRQLHLIMKQQNLHIRQWHCSVFPGTQSPRHFHTRRIRALVLLLPPTFALPNRAIYRLYTPPPQLLFPPCEMELGALDVQPHVNPVFLEKSLWPH